MAATLVLQAAAAVDSVFRAMVEDAVAQEAVLVYNSPTTLSANLLAAAQTAVPIQPTLAAAMASGTVFSVGGELVTASATAAIGAASITVVWTPARTHFVGEVVTPPSLANHALRAAFASRILQSPAAMDQWANIFAWVLASQGIDKTSTDSAILTGVANAWNLLAGA